MRWVWAETSGKDRLPERVAAKGRLIRCTIPGSTPNYLAMTRTLGRPGAVRASRIRFSSIGAIGGRPRPLPFTLYPLPFTLYPLPFTLYPLPFSLYLYPLPFPLSPLPTLYPLPFTLYPLHFTFTLYLYPLPDPRKPGTDSFRHHRSLELPSGSRVRMKRT